MSDAGFVPLHNVFISGDRPPELSYELIKLFVDSGANLNALTKQDGMIDANLSVLDLAKRNRSVTPEIIDLLIKHGAKRGPAWYERWFSRIFS